LKGWASTFYNAENKKKNPVTSDHARGEKSNGLKGRHMPETYKEN